LLRRVPNQVAVSEDDQEVESFNEDAQSDQGVSERRRHERISLDAPNAPTDNPNSVYAGPERRKAERRSMDTIRKEVEWKLAPEVENKILRGMGFKTSRRSSIKPSKIYLIIVALIAGGLAAFIAMQGESAPTPEVQTTVEPVAAPTPIVQHQILVAKDTIGMGQTISANQVEWINWPEASIRSDYITIENAPEAIEQMSGTMTRFEFFAGEPIREQKLARGASGYLSAIIAPGMRGVSVPIVAEAASGGFIVPNDHVDVVLTKSTESGRTSETILRNVRVLAINSRVGEIQNDGEAKNEAFSDNAIATLELNEIESEMIVGATDLGTFALVLRSMSDFAGNRQLERSALNQSIRMTSPFWQQSNDQPDLR